MAGDWIKMRVDLADDPAVIGNAGTTGLDEDAVVGKLHRLWSWADRHLVKGNAPSVSEKWIDRYLGATDFAAAMVKVNWLIVNDLGVTFPNFERHNLQTGKQRALTAKRVAKSKGKSNAEGNGASVSGALPTGEKRREDINTSSKEDVCSEVAEPPAEPERSAFDFPVVGKGGNVWNLPKHELANYVTSYPDLDVEQQLRKARQWCQTNKRRRKSASGMLRFLTSWMNRATDEKPPPMFSNRNETPPERNLLIPPRNG